ncbi:MAG: sodium:proton exchanger [Saprospiraceae bacterium]|nr:sodium:proton exchanger [Saprospiraceae bacterium]
MDFLSPYNLIIEGSVILIISFFFNELSKKTSVPSVLMLIVLGILIKVVLDFLEAGKVDFFRILEILGIVGLIMIVLEAALELKLERDKVVPITKALIIGFVGLMLSTWVTAMILEYFVEGMDTLRAWIYATPLSILSSAIVIPSVNDLRKDKKEFHIYESTFSDILGIMLFYFLTSQVENEGEGSGLVQFGFSTLLTIILSVVLSYLIVIIFQNIKSHVKLFLLIAVLLLLYAVGKKMHLSSLIIILVFGLVIANITLFFQGWLKRFLDPEKAKDIYNGLHVITIETAFVVRTFFFVIFGITITFASLGDWNVIGVSILLLLVIYVIRWIILRVSIGEDIFPQLYIAPRGLITILLFYAIPKEAEVATFSQGILLFIIIGTAVIMTVSMIFDKKRSMSAIKEASDLPVSTIKWKLPQDN